MKKVIIASLVAAVILFVYQAFSWMVSPIHKNSMKYTPNQDTIQKVLGEYLTEDAVYGIPTAPPGTSQKEHMELGEKMKGKPWAIVQFHKSYENNMGKTMPVGFLLNLIAAMIVSWILLKAGSAFNTFGRRWFAVFLFGVFITFQGELMEWNWWHMPCNYLCGEIIDNLLSWTLAGLWLAWYFGRKPKTT